jgi:two-component system sensor histidine kinase YesM
MTEEEIKNIFTAKEKKETSIKRIGIKNIKSRISLNCGEEYGVKIESEKNKYTRVKLILPVLIEKEN